MSVKKRLRKTRLRVTGGERPFDWVPQGFGEGYVNMPFVYYDGELLLGDEGARHEEVVDASDLDDEVKDLLKAVHMGCPELLPDGTTYFDGIIDYWWDENEDFEEEDFEEAAIVYPWSLHGMTVDDAKRVIENYAKRVYVVKDYGFKRLARRPTRAPRRRRTAAGGTPVVFLEGQVVTGDSFDVLFRRAVIMAVKNDMAFPEDVEWLVETLRAAHEGNANTAIDYFDGVLDEDGVLRVNERTVSNCGPIDFTKAVDELGGTRYELVDEVTASTRGGKTASLSACGSFRAYLDEGVLTVLGKSRVNSGDAEIARWAERLGCSAYAVVNDFTGARATRKYLTAVPAAEAVGEDAPVGGRVTVDSPPDEGRVGPFAYVDGEVYSDGGVHAEVLANAFPEEEADALAEVRFGRPGVGPKKDWAESVGFAAGHLYEDGALVEADSVRNASRNEVVQAVLEAFPGVDRVYFTLGDCKNGGEYQVERVAAAYAGSTKR